MTGIITNNLGRSSGLIKTAVAADDSITLAKMASGTDGNIISYDASGNPVAIATGSDGQVLTSTGAGSPPAFEAVAGGGKIGQVLQDTLGTLTSTTSDGTYADISGLAQAITPVATSSKVLILVSLAGIVNAAANGIIYFRISGGNTDSYLGTDTGGGGEQAGNAWTARRAGFQQGNCNLMFLDAPSTSSAVTYQVQWQKYDGTAYINASNNDNAQSAYCMSTITCMEVLA